MGIFSGEIVMNCCHCLLMGENHNLHLSYEGWCNAACAEMFTLWEFEIFVATHRMHAVELDTKPSGLCDFAHWQCTMHAASNFDMTMCRCDVCACSAGFRTLLIEDQMAVLKSSFMELSILRLAFRYVDKRFWAGQRRGRKWHVNQRASAGSALQPPAPTAITWTTTVLQIVGITA